MFDEGSFHDFMKEVSNEYFAKIQYRLQKTNEEYRDLLFKLEDIYNKYPKLDLLLGDKDFDSFKKNYDSLSLNECEKIVDYLIINEQLKDILLQEVYFKGGCEVFYEFNKLSENGEEQ